MNTPMAGTSIQDLHRNERMEHYDNVPNLNIARPSHSLYGARQNQQYEQGHNAAHHVQQAQQAPYYAMDENYNYPQWVPPPPGELPPSVGMPPRVSDEPDIEDLARDISKNLAGETFNPSMMEVSDEENSKKSGGLLSFVPPLLREPLIIVVLYVILSEAFVKNTIGKYVPQINPDFTGRVSRTGVVIYGILFAVLFMVARKLLLK